MDFVICGHSQASCFLNFPVFLLSYVSCLLAPASCRTTDLYRRTRCEDVAYSIQTELFAWRQTTCLVSRFTSLSCGPLSMGSRVFSPASSRSAHRLYILMISDICNRFSRLKFKSIKYGIKSSKNPP